MEYMSKAKEALQKSEDVINKMSLAKSLKVYEDYWIQFLNLYDRAWNKTHNELNQYSKYSGWKEKGKAISDRKKDPLLSYLKNARGADHHTIKDVTKKDYGSLAITPDGLDFELKKVKLGNLDIEFKKESVKLQPVINRGVKYKVPTEHLGSKLKNDDPILIAKKAVKYLENYISKAEYEVVKR